MRINHKGHKDTKNTRQTENENLIPNEARASSVPSRRRAPRPWLIPLLWIAISVLAAVAPWAWRRLHAPPTPPPHTLRPLALTGDSHRDRLAILERAAELLQPPGPMVSPGENVFRRASLLGEIGLEFLPLDRARGTEAVQRAIQMAIRPADRITAADLDTPERTMIGLLVRLARSLRPYPSLAERALQTASEEARSNHSTVNRIYALCLFGREAATVDPTRARTAVHQAEASAVVLPVEVAADPIAAVAAAVAPLEGASAARPLVERALRSVPSGAARPLVEARLAARLAEAAPAQARELAAQAVADVGRQGRSSGPPVAAVQCHDIAVILAVTHPEESLAAVQRIPSAGARVAAMVDMAAACDVRAPARAEALSRRALRQARALPDARQRQSLLYPAAYWLAAYDLKTARDAVSSLPGPGRAVDVMLLAVRAIDKQPGAGRKLIEKVRGDTPSSFRAIAGSDDIYLAEVTAEPNLGRALALAQQAPSPELEAAALQTVARRLKRSGELPAVAVSDASDRPRRSKR